jgi:HAD superfamily hydrolase (TIGR01662 family)
MNMKISTVLFDLGSTLVYSKDPWHSFYEQADRALVEVLHRAGYELDASTFFAETGGFIHSYYDRSFEDNFEPTSFTVLQEMLDRKGYKNIPETILRAALDALYTITQQNWYLEEDAIPTLEKLISLGYQLGIISNTSDDRNVQGIVDRWELRLFFETIITSAALGIRKPDTRIFQIALGQLGIQPDAAAMVGDTLDADVLGANLSGIYSIWITRRAQETGEGELAIQPQAVIATLSQLPDLLTEINNDLSVST